MRGCVQTDMMSKKNRRDGYHSLFRHRINGSVGNGNECSVNGYDQSTKSKFNGYYYYGMHCRVKYCVINVL